MKIGILGIGMIGNALKKGFESQYQVTFYDPKYLESKFLDVLDSDFVFICVPTDQKEDGSCDTSIVNKCLSDLNKNNYKGIVIIKSTVRPGFTQNSILRHPLLRIAFVPEFLRERCAYEDFMNTETLIIGTDDYNIFKKIREIHSFLNAKNVVKVETFEAEIVKYMSNVYKAMKVVYSNIIYELTNKLDGNYENVLESFLRLGIREEDYMKVTDDFRGYGGYCLPKDTTALAHVLEEHGFKFDLINSIDKDNKQFKTTVPKGMRI